MFGKIITEMLTPFSLNKRLDFVVLNQYLSYLSQNYTNSLVINGELSEYDKLAPNDKLRFIKATYTLKNPKIKLLYLIDKELPSLSTIDKYIDGYIVKGLDIDYKPLVNKPLIMMDYDINKIDVFKPRGIILSKATLPLISKIKNTYPDVSIYLKSAELILSGLSSGASGIITTSSNLYGDTLHLLMQLLKMKEDYLARDLFSIYLPRFKLLENHPNNINILKTALKKIGISFYPVNSTKKELLRFIGV